MSEGKAGHPPMDPTDLPLLDPLTEERATEELDLDEDDLATVDGSDEDVADADTAGETTGGPDIPDKLYFRIGEVGQIVGVDAHVLRYWEAEFRMKPHRSGSGQRLYRKQDLARFLRIRRLLHDEGYTIAGARKILSGGAAPGPSVDAARLKEVLDHLAGLRRRIQALRDELDPQRRS